MPPRRNIRAGPDTPPMEEHGPTSVKEFLQSLTYVVCEHVVGGVPPSDKEVEHEDRTAERF